MIPSWKSPPLCRGMEVAEASASSSNSCITIGMPSSQRKELFCSSTQKCYSRPRASRLLLASSRSTASSWGFQSGSNAWDSAMGYHGGLPHAATEHLHHDASCFHRLRCLAIGTPQRGDQHAARSQLHGEITTYGLGDQLTNGWTRKCLAPYFMSCSVF